MININDIEKERLKNIITEEVEYWSDVDDDGNISVPEDCFKHLVHHSIQHIIAYLETLND